MHEGDLGQQLRTLVYHAREKELSKLQLMTLQAARDAIEPIINTPIYELNPDFWQEIRAPYITEMHDLSEHCYRILQGINYWMINIFRGVQLLSGGGVDVYRCS